MPTIVWAFGPEDSFEMSLTSNMISAETLRFLSLYWDVIDLPKGMTAEVVESVHANSYDPSTSFDPAHHPDLVELRDRGHLVSTPFANPDPVAAYARHTYNQVRGTPNPYGKKYRYHISHTNTATGPWLSEALAEIEYPSNAKMKRYLRSIGVEPGMHTATLAGHLAPSLYAGIHQTLKRIRNQPEWDVCYLDQGLAGPFESLGGSLKSPDSDPKPERLAVELLEGIPVPLSSVPMDQVLDFKARRRDNLHALRGHIDELCESVARSGSPLRSLNNETKRLAREVNDLTRLMQESRIPRFMESVAKEIETPGYEVFGSGMGTAALLGVTDPATLIAWGGVSFMAGLVHRSVKAVSEAGSHLNHGRYIVQARTELTT
ncbi:DUF6236 family protein [Rubrivirga sp.]|uniref:DUF6236 family protein n=1 Tax=Rubrivirga sp. TaxID=1885344 RepID=UPI003C74C92D